MGSLALGLCFRFAFSPQADLDSVSGSGVVAPSFGLDGLTHQTSAWPRRAPPVGPFFQQRFNFTVAFFDLGLVEAVAPSVRRKELLFIGALWRNSAHDGVLGGSQNRRLTGALKPVGEPDSFGIAVKALAKSRVRFPELSRSED